MFNVSEKEPKLRRVLNLPLTVMYGVGTILGAGVYALIGKIAGIAGIHSVWAFLVASIIATFSALSYAELSSRFPQSAGEAYYIQQGFRRKHFSLIIGILIVMSGIVSAATLIHGFVGYFQEFFNFSDTTIIISLITFICIITCWGIKQSVVLASAITLLEIFGLLLILWTGKSQFLKIPQNLEVIIPSTDPVVLTGIFTGGLVAFFSFICFEDIVYIGEEVKNPRKTLPRAIIYSLIIATILYMGIALVSVLSISTEELSTSKAPLATVLARNSNIPVGIINLIALFAIINGAFIQIIMASRLLYGMANQNWIPKIFSIIHAGTRTPIYNTIFVCIITLIFSLWFPILTLAKITGFILITVFIFVNASLCMIKLRSSESPDSAWIMPVWIPVLAVVLSFAFLLFQISLI